MSNCKDERRTTIVNGRRYNLDHIEKSHQGGEDLFKLAYGNDVTALIYSYHPRPELIFNSIKKHQITGSEEQTKDSIYSFDSLVYQQVKATINRYFRLTKKNTRDVLYLRSFFLLTLTLCTYILSLTIAPILAPLFGVCLACIGLCIQHDANHGAYSASPKINHIMGLLDDLIGGSSLIWRHQHNLIHHTYCNHNELDEDTNAALPFIRYHPSKPYYKHMKFQHLYSFFVYSLMGIVAPFSSTYSILTKTHGNLKIHRLTFKDKMEFLFIKLIYVLYMFVIPFLIFHWSFIWIFYLPAQLTGGLYLALLFSVSHNNLKVEASSQLNSSEWAINQIITSANWASESTFWNIISGGLNCQIEHHLFPNVSHIHYPILHRIVKKSCIKFNIPYNDYKDFRSIASDHLRLLKKLSASNYSTL